MSARSQSFLSADYAEAKTGICFPARRDQEPRLYQAKRAGKAQPFFERAYCGQGKVRLPLRDQQSLCSSTSEVQLSDSYFLQILLRFSASPDLLRAASLQFPGGKSFEQTFVEMLQKYGYKGKYRSADWYAKPVFIQSFAPTSLQAAAQYTDLPLVFLYDAFTARTQDTNQVGGRLRDFFNCH